MVKINIGNSTKEIHDDTQRNYWKVVTKQGGVGLFNETVGMIQTFKLFEPLC